MYCVTEPASVYVYYTRINSKANLFVDHTVLILLEVHVSEDTHQVEYYSVHRIFIIPENLCFLASLFWLQNSGDRTIRNRSLDRF